jgi:hypothetical protein
VVAASSSRASKTGAAARRLLELEVEEAGSFDALRRLTAGHAVAFAGWYASRDEVAA